MERETEKGEMKMMGKYVVRAGRASSPCWVRIKWSGDEWAVGSSFEP